jgi:hypothetical protein
MPDLLPEWAFYYPNPVWSQSRWLKNLILFFDGIALLPPEDGRQEPVEQDREATVLRERGLLTVLEPQKVVDRRGADVLAAAMTDFITSGDLDELARRETQFHALSYSPLAYLEDAGLTERIYDALHNRELAGGHGHALVRSLVLVLFAQVLRPAGRRHGMYLCPVTDRPELHGALTEMLGLPSMASSAHVVSLNLVPVGVDLTEVPIEDVIAYRSATREEYRRFTRDLRAFVHQTVDTAADDQFSALLELQGRMADAAAGLLEAASRAWRQPASFAIGFAGGAWALRPFDIMGKLLALGSEAAAADEPAPTRAGAFSYLFSDRRAQLGVRD